jgi:hypothetical protein
VVYAPPPRTVYYAVPVSPVYVTAPPAAVPVVVPVPVPAPASAAAAVIAPAAVPVNAAVTAPPLKPLPMYTTIVVAPPTTVALAPALAVNYAQPVVTMPR